MQGKKNRHTSMVIESEHTKPEKNPQKAKLNWNSENRVKPLENEGLPFALCAGWPGFDTYTGLWSKPILVFLALVRC
jgi:hypothetical protein